MLSDILLYPHTSTEVSLEVDVNNSSELTKIPNDTPPLLIETAIANNIDEFYFNIPLLLCVLFTNVKYPISKDDYLGNWKRITTTSDMSSSLNNIANSLRNSFNLENKLLNYNIYLIHKGEVEKQGKFIIN